MTPRPTLGALMGSEAAGPLGDQVPAGLCLDSRALRPGELFIALRGTRLDGRRYLSQAAAAGAMAALVEDALLTPEVAPPLPVIVVPNLRRQLGDIAARFFGQPSRALHIAAVTGTNGKTTVSQLLGQLLRGCGYDCGVIGTLGASLDGRVHSALNTTPDPLQLQSTLAHWVEAAVPFVCMEASSHALDQGRLSGVEIDTAVFTNLSRDHLDYHGSMAAYGEAKSRLFQWPGLRHALINADDAFADTLVRHVANSAECLRYSIAGAPADLRLSRLEFDARGLRARLDSPWGRGALRSPLIGRFNAGNLLAALATALCAGLPLDQLLRVAQTLQPVSGRMEALRERGRPLVVIDYAHTPDALQQVLTALRPQVRGRLVAVFGCGGDRDRGKRPEMAAVASAHADAIVLTSDNPRSEEPRAIIADIEAGATGDYRVIVDRAEAIAAAIATAGPDDCVLIAGKGHEDYQLIGAQRIAFSDREQARLALEERAA